MRFKILAEKAIVVVSHYNFTNLFRNFLPSCEWFGLVKSGVVWCAR